MTALSSAGKDAVASRKRRFKRGQAVLGTLLLIIVVWFGLYLRSDAFRELVRRKVVAELEVVTGGKVEIQSFTWKLSKLQFEARGVTIHGREAAGQAPFIEAERIAGQARITSFFRARAGLESLVIDHPVVHLIVYPDGTTNQPMPKINEQDKTVVQPLFDMAISRLDINNAELLLNEKKIPFDFKGERLSGGMSYSRAANNYEGNFSIDLVAAQYQSFSPFRGTLELHFLMTPTQVEVKALKFTAGQSVLEATGTVANYNNPEVHAEYSASLDLEEVGRIARIPQLQAGHLDVKGSGMYQNAEYASEGALAASKLEWRDSGWRLAGSTLTSPFTISPTKIALTELRSSAFGGSAKGEMQVLNWSSPPVEKKLVQRGKASFRLLNMQAGELAAAISSERLPLNKINLAGTVSGGVNSSWTGSPRNAITELTLDVNPPANPSARQLPVTATFQGSYHSATETLEVGGLNFATRGIRLNATGTLGSNAAQLRVAFNADSLQELQPVLAVWMPRAKLPLDVHGRASFNGTLFGKFSAISARGKLDLDDFDTLLAMAQQGPSRIHWDSVAAEILLTPSSLSAQNGFLKRGATRAAFSGSAGFVKGRFDESLSQITANFQLQNAGLADAQSLIGFNYPITGILNADLHAAGTLRNLRGGGSINAAKLTIYGEPFSSLRANINFAGEETQFNNIVLTHNGAQLTGSAAFNLPAQSFRFNLNGANIELANFRHYQPQRLSMAGRAEFHASGSGTLATPVIDAQLNFRRLVLNGELVGDLTASAETHGDNMVLRAKSNFQNASFALDGSVRLRDDFPGQMTLKFEHLDFDPLIRAYAQVPITGHSSIEGSIDLRGPLKTPRALSVAANISQLSANVENIKLHNDGLVRFSINRQNLHIDQFHLTGDEVDLALRGDANLGGEQTLDIHADGKADLKLLQSFNGNITSSGQATLAVHLAGTISQPQVRGRMDIVNGGISAVDLPNGLTQINGRLVFAQDRMQIENLRAHTGGGDLDLVGFIAYRNGFYFDVTATGKDVRLRYPPGLSASANASLRYTGSAQNSLLAGNVTVIRLAVDPRFDFAQYLRTKNPVRTGSQNPILENLRLDIHIVSMPELRVETSLAKVSGDADLRIRGTVANPAVLGRVNIAEGDVFFNGTRYRLERGDVTFSNPQVIQPIVNVEMSARVRDYDITIGFHGPIDRMSITYRSDPPLPSGDIIALLAFGRTKEEDIYSSQSTATLTTSDTMLEQALTRSSNSRVQKLFGVGSVKIDPQVVGAENNLGPRVTIEQQIQNNITLTYITNLTQSSSEQVIQVEYNVSRSISVVAVRDQNGILGFEVRIRKRKR
ncbi:MAG TPA: translocation/assembly module TamB domain-containing protein [Candidatus Angelobacter sp.]